MPQGEGYAGVSVHILSNLDIYIVPVFQIGEDIFKSTVLESDAVFCPAAEIIRIDALHISGLETSGGGKLLAGRKDYRCEAFALHLNTAFAQGHLIIAVHIRIAGIEFGTEDPHIHIAHINDKMPVRRSHVEEGFSVQCDLALSFRKIASEFDLSA